MKIHLEHLLRVDEPLSTERMESLWEKYRDGDDAVLVTLLACFGNRLYRRVWGVVRSDHAEDVFQEVLVKLHQKRRKLATFNDAMKWLRAVAKNHALDACRRNARRLARDHRASRPEVISQTDTDIHEAIRSALGRLTDEQREAIALYFFEGLSKTSAAAFLGIDRDTFSARLSRALERLRSVVPAPAILAAGGALGIEQHLAARPRTLPSESLAGLVAEAGRISSLNWLLMGKWKCVGLILTASVGAGVGLVLQHRPADHVAARPAKAVTHADPHLPPQRTSDQIASPPALPLTSKVQTTADEMPPIIPGSSTSLPKLSRCGTG